MEKESKQIVIAQMEFRKNREWAPVVPKQKEKHHYRRLQRNTVIFAAVSFCIGTTAFFAVRKPQSVQSVMSHLTAGFEYDDTLGRLQFVSNVLPESAMVFLSSKDDVRVNMIAPVSSSVMHIWNSNEPWIEYAHVGDVSACHDGEIMTIIQNHQNEYTVRVMHADGYESIYSGLSTVHIPEHEHVSSGQAIGTATGFTAFELRKDGLSVLPSFASI